jgi:hypothetical protein
VRSSELEAGESALEEMSGRVAGVDSKVAEAEARAREAEGRLRDVERQLADKDGLLKYVEEEVERVKGGCVGGVCWRVGAWSSLHTCCMSHFDRFGGRLNVNVCVCGHFIAPAGLYEKREARLREERDAARNAAAATALQQVGPG